MHPARPRSSLVAVLLVAPGVGLACQGPEAGNQGDPENLRTEVRATVEGYLQAVATRDTAAIRAVFVDDGRLAWLEGGEVRYRSVDAMLASLAEFPPEATLRTRLEDLTIVPAGSDAAHAWARFETTVSGSGGFSFAGALSLVLERTPEGWRIVGGHSS